MNALSPIFSSFGWLYTNIVSVPILNALVGLYKLLVFIHVPGAFGLAIIILTVLMRFIFYPLTKMQLESTKKLAKLKPQIDELHKIHKGDKARIQQETMRVYQESGANPAAGCLPMLVSFPFLIALYQLFFGILSLSDMSKMLEKINQGLYAPWLKIESLDLSFFGMNLAHKPSEWQKFGWWLLAIPLITALLQYWQTRLMMPQGASSTNDKSKALAKTASDKDKKADEPDTSAAVQKQMAVMMPLMIGYFAYSFPLGLSLYWNVQSIFGIIQQYQVNKSK